MRSHEDEDDASPARKKGRVMKCEDVRDVLKELGTKRSLPSGHVVVRTLAEPEISLRSPGPRWPAMSWMAEFRRTLWTSQLECSKLCKTETVETPSFI